MITTHLDWLRWTCPYPYHVPEERALAWARYPLPEFDYTGEVFTPGQGYNRGRVLNAGSITWHAEHKEQGIGIMHTGMQLQQIRGSSLTEQEYLKWIDKRHGKVSTMDACINVHDEGADVLDLIKARDAGTLRTRAKMIGYYSSTTKVGDTWIPSGTAYIGSTKSAIQVMVYNKAAEQQIDGDWTRIEITWRGKHAQSAHAAMLKSGIGPVTLAAIQHQVDFSAAWWLSAMQGGASRPAVVRKPTGGRFTWLKDSVLSALEKEIDDERRQNSDEIYEIFAAFMERKRPK